MKPKIEVAVTALHRDAAKWAETGLVMEEAKFHIVAGQSVADSFGFLGKMTSADNEYRHLTTVLIGLAEQAVDEFYYGEECLLRVAQEYRSTEDDISAKMKGFSAKIRTGWHL